MTTAYLSQSSPPARDVKAVFDFHRTLSRSIVEWSSACDLASLDVHVTATEGEHHHQRRIEHDIGQHSIQHFDPCHLLCISTLSNVKISKPVRIQTTASGKMVTFRSSAALLHPLTSHELLVEQTAKTLMFSRVAPFATAFQLFTVNSTYWYRFPARV